MLPLNAIEKEMSAICEDYMKGNGKEEQGQGEKQGAVRVRIYPLVIEHLEARGLGTEVSSITHILN
ncbi:hypothetical protein ES707_08128 [subsurface metagenome]